MAAPTVDDLQTLINQYKTALAPQQQVLDSQITANDTSGQQQIQGLDAQKTTAFKGITQAANDRGGYFSGFTPDQEATYTAGTYLPALAQLQGTIASTRASLLGKKADLDTQANTSAIDTRNNQMSALQVWQNQQDQLAAQAAEAERQRQFTAQQQAAQNAFTASQNAADRSAKASSSPDVAGTVAKVGSFLQSKVGKDGKVSPATFQAGRQQWIAAGGDPSSYAQAFFGYVNTSHQKDYF